jgi:hypothetical protein
MTQPTLHQPRIIPPAYRLLSNWRYLEYSLLRILAGWGRGAADWEDKLAMSYHVWLQAETVERMRRRLDMFPGGKKDGPVHAIFETVANAVLLAPSFADAMAGVHRLNGALAQTYRNYLSASHPVHDYPTHDLLREVLAMKQTQAAWYEDFRRRCPKAIDDRYLAGIDAQLAAMDQCAKAVEPSDAPAAACGINTGFRMDITPGRPKGWNDSPDVMPFLEVDWSTSAEARRLYFMIGYMREMGVAEEQLRWIYHADFMPFEYVHAESRHMWDESRHGNSGLSRLRDFGLDLSHVYYDSYGKHGEGKLDPMMPADVYNGFYGVTQIAETGYFETKRYCFEDFAAGRDESSAEMMQFDIIDETSHAEYGREWLPTMMQRAGVEEDYRARGRQDRLLAQQRSDARAMALRQFAQTGATPIAPGQYAVDTGVSPTASSLQHNFAILADPKAQAHYQWLLQELRGQHPLKNLQDMPPRPNLPM